MAASRETDHRRRVLDHQEKAAAERRKLAAEAADPQLRIPLIGEVRRAESPPPKRRRARTKKPIQPELGGS